MCLYNDDQCIRLTYKPLNMYIFTKTMNGRLRSGSSHTSMYEVVCVGFESRQPEFKFLQFFQVIYINALMSLILITL